MTANNDGSTASSEEQPREEFFVTLNDTSAANPNEPQEEGGIPVAAAAAADTVAADGDGSSQQCEQGSNNEQGSNAQSSNVSEMSSSGVSAEDDANSNNPMSQIEALTRTVMMTSHQRRQQRRQWNPSYQTSYATTIQRGLPQVVAPSDAPLGPITSAPMMVQVAGSKTLEREEDVEAPAVAPSPSVPEVFQAVVATQSPEENEPSSSTSPQQQQQQQSLYTREAGEDSKFDEYSCIVDRSQNDRSVEIPLYSLKRPHMRAFHLAWISFFTAFFIWFSITPLLTEVQRSLDLTHKEIWTSSTYGVASSAVTRLLIGPLCDKYGARWVMAITLLVSAIPTGLTGLVQTPAGLNILRLFIGVAGSAFVTSQFWTSSMFTHEVAGTANALVAGWGNLGGGVTQIVMGSLLFPLFKVIYDDGETSDGGDDDYDRASDLAWRTACILPAILGLIVSVVTVKTSDDCPKGNVSKRHRQGYTASVSAVSAVMEAMSDLNTWILFIQYACCFGVEITMVNASALYFKEVFGQSTASAAAIASIFGWMNLFARGVGGFLSDFFNARYGMRGRLWVQVLALLLQGAFTIFFGQTETLAAAIVVLAFLSIFVQCAEGSTYG